MSGFSHVYLAISQKKSSWIPENITQPRGFELSKGENTKINPGELFDFKIFLCCGPNHPEPSERALLFGFSESLRLVSVLTLAGMCYVFVLHRACGQMGSSLLGSSSGVFLSLWLCFSFCKGQCLCGRKFHAMTASVFCFRHQKVFL